MPRRCRRAPQSRDRLYVAYWLKALGRQPDWDKRLRPNAYCDTCDQEVAAVQSFKQAGVDMGRYGKYGQYVYRCPHVRCRNQIVEPFVAPAATAIDWTLPPGAKIGERRKPLEDSTLTRIRIGLARYASTGTPFLQPAGGTWRTAATGIDQPMPTRTTRETDALVVPPFITTMRGGGSKKSAHELDKPLATFAASGIHHGLVQHPDTDPREVQHLLVPYYRTGVARPAQTHPLGTLPTRERYALVGAGLDAVLEECTFRMLDCGEIRNGMAFPAAHKALGDKTTQARGYGNAVTPPVAELLGCALVETITGEDIEQFENTPHAA
ncbi:hypothetical protein GFY24_38910 [Nocardia sp. SYP-A9097]|uniref:hypothetical protein n=1 Tax=Nocardia sp. SYP-A9097 TaxID=2663237 RepID=UPI00129AD536|nr:hypothetical protein [Nocardia sp. SYP-A9097]MRH93321.1 hypothetical protein [Nocardia sp. SYP-A9097]